MRNGLSEVPDIRPTERFCHLETKVMHPSVEFFNAGTDGVKSMDGRAEKGEENSLPQRETLALLGGKCGVSRESHDGAGSFQVAGEKVSTWVDDGLSGCSCVRSRGERTAGWEIRHCHGRGSGTRSLSNGKKVVWEEIVHLATWCCKILGQEKSGLRAPSSWLFFFFFFFLYHVFIVFRYKKLHAALGMEKTKPTVSRQKSW